MLVSHKADDETAQLFTKGKKDPGGDSSSPKEPSIYSTEQLLTIQ